MPLAPVADNNTDCWYLDYYTGHATTGVEHTWRMRLPPTAGVDGASGVFYHLLNAIGAANFWTGWKPLRMRYRASGSNFTVPAGMGASLSAFVGTGAMTNYTSSFEAVEHTVQGRSPSTGRRVDYSLYGIKLGGMPGAFRYLSSAGAPYTNWIAAHATLPTLVLTRDGSSATFYPYVNLNFNSYWETRIRTV